MVEVEAGEGEAVDVVEMWLVRLARRRPRAHDDEKKPTKVHGPTTTDEISGPRRWHAEAFLVDLLAKT